MPKLPRTWVRGSANILDTRDFNLYVVTTVQPGQTVERIHLSYRIMGRWSESEILELFDAYYVGIQVISSAVVLPDNDAYVNRNSQKWLWWEGAHYNATPYTGSPGQVLLTYPRDGSVRDIRAKRLNSTQQTQSVVFSFARSGGPVLTDQRVNANASVLLLG